MGELTPGARFLRDSCIRTLMVSVLYQLTHLEYERLCTNREDGRQEPPSCPLPHQLLKAVSNCCFSGEE